MPGLSHKNVKEKREAQIVNDLNLQFEMKHMNMWVTHGERACSWIMSPLLIVMTPHNEVFVDTVDTPNHVSLTLRPEAYFTNREECHAHGIELSMLACSTITSMLEDLYRIDCDLSSGSH